MSDGGESRAEWLDQMLSYIGREGLEIRCDDGVYLGFSGHGICNSAGAIIASGETINDALGELSQKLP